MRKFGLIVLSIVTILIAACTVACGILTDWFKNWEIFDVEGEKTENEGESNSVADGSYCVVLFLAGNDFKEAVFVERGKPFGENAPWIDVPKFCSKYGKDSTKGFPKGFIWVVQGEVPQGGPSDEEMVSPFYKSRLINESITVKPLFVYQDAVPGGFGENPLGGWIDQSGKGDDKGSGGADDGNAGNEGSGGNRGDEGSGGYGGNEEGSDGDLVNGGSDGVDGNRGDETKPQEPDSETPPLHTHTFSDVWTSNGFSHYHKCAECEETIGNSPHELDSSETCVICGYKKPPHVHEFSSSWTYDASSHWHQCRGCPEKKNQTRHEVSPGSNCSTCGYRPMINDGRSTVNGLPYNCDCIAYDTGRCRQNCPCGVYCNNACPCNCFAESLPCGCVIEDCECYFGKACLGGGDSCNCECHEKPNNGDGQFLACSYLFGENYGYDTSNGEYKVAITFPSPLLRNSFYVDLTIGNNVSFTIVPQNTDGLFRLIAFSVQGTQNAIARQIQSGNGDDGDLNGSFEMFCGLTGEYCEGKDEHSFIVRVYVEYTDDLYSAVSYVGLDSLSLDAGYEPVIRHYNFLATDEMTLFIHSDFACYVKKVTFGETKYGFDPDKPFGGFYQFPILSMSSNPFIIEFMDEATARDEYGFELESVDSSELVLESPLGVGGNYAVYFTSDGRIKVDLCSKQETMKIERRNVSKGYENEISLKSQTFECGGYIAFDSSCEGLQIYVGDKRRTTKGGGV